MTEYLQTSVCDKESETYDYLTELVEEQPGISNYSQAVRYCINTAQQADEASEHRLANAEPRQQPDNE